MDEDKTDQFADYIMEHLNLLTQNSQNSTENLPKNELHNESNDNSNSFDETNVGNSDDWDKTTSSESTESKLSFIEEKEENGNWDKTFTSTESEDTNSSCSSRKKSDWDKSSSDSFESQEQSDETFCSEVEQSIINENNDDIEELDESKETNLETISIKKYRKDKTNIFRLKRKNKNKRKDEDNIKDGIGSLLESYRRKELEKLVKDVSLETNSSFGKPGSVSIEENLDEFSNDPLNLKLSQEFTKILKNKELLPGKFEILSLDIQQKEVLQKIDDILNKASNGSLLIFSHRMVHIKNCVFEDNILQFRSDPHVFSTKIFSRRVKSNPIFQAMVVVLEKIKEMLLSNTRLSQREIYYQLKEVLKSPWRTRTIINKISNMLDVGPWVLNIIGNHGMVYGDLKIMTRDGQVQNCNIPNSHIPSVIDDIIEFQSTAKFILVVEKEAIYMKLIEEKLPNSLTKPFILFTGKGFPDIHTRRFLKKLWLIMSIPIFILVDCDPYGIQIMLTYKYGSMEQAHLSKYLAVPVAKWLGVFPSEINLFNLPKMPLNERENKLLQNMLKYPYVESDEALKKELNILLQTQHKTGIEGVILTENFLTDIYIPNKFCSQDFK